MVSMYVPRHVFVQVQKIGEGVKSSESFIVTAPSLWTAMPCD